MSDAPSQPAGTIGWTDLTVENAGELRDFYEAVVGWRPSEVDMGGYSDFNMNRPSDGMPAAGICWRRGSNSKLPPFWLIYIRVEDLDASLAQCEQRGGKLLDGPKKMGADGRYAIIQDPAGAYSALVEQ